METWRSFLRLPGCDRRIVLASATGLLATWIGLRLVGFRRWQRALGWLVSAKAANPDAKDAGMIERAREIAGLEAAAVRNFPWCMNCLEQSLVLWWLLRQRGIPAEFRIGVRKDAEGFEAHAWVEVEGTNPSEADTEHINFVPFEGLIASLHRQTH
jgi:Transglutaminase-like superfamily